jgi:hypothetical protein
VHDENDDLMVKREFKFYKNDKGEWWLDLPEWKGDPADLQMIEGADEWLDLVSEKGVEIYMTLADQKFEGAENLSLLRIREENFGGGGIYYLETYQSKKVGLKLWLCEVTRFVFGCIPQKIYFKII